MVINYVIYCFYLCVYIFTLTIVKIVFNHQQYKLRHTRSIIINLRELIFEIRISFKKYDTLKLLEKKEKIFNIRYKSSKDRDYIKESRALPILLLNEEQGTREQLPGTPESLLTRHTVTDAHANSFQMYAEDGNACGEAWRRRILAEGSVKKYFSPTMERRGGAHIYIYTHTDARTSIRGLTFDAASWISNWVWGLSSEVSWPRTSPLYSAVPRFVVHGESSLTFREARLLSSWTVIRLFPSFPPPSLLPSMKRCASKTIGIGDKTWW